MSIELITVLMIVTLLLVLVLGQPLSISLGGIAMVFTLAVWGPKGLYMAATTALSAATSDILLAVPLFVFMGAMLQTSGIADDLYDMIHHLFGSVRGGLAIGTVGICTVFAAMAGISAVATVTMGLVALPSMLSRGYDKKLALGSIAAGGALGILIPPSVTMILYALLARESVGKLFAGGIMPGLLLAGLFVVYIAVMCFFKPKIAPAIKDEARLPLVKRLVYLKAAFWPVLLIGLVLGTIYSGICTPTEASGIGALGSVIAVITNRRFTKNTFFSASITTLKITSMVMWIVIGSGCFSAIYNAAGSQELVTNVLANLPGGRWAVFIVLQAIYFILGTFLDPTGIVMLCTPVFVPVIIKLGFDPIWFGITFIINMEMAYLTPPFGFNLFYLRSIVPEGITMGHIYRSVLPFIALQMLCLVLVSVFPQIILWLPNMMK
ncbi:MAG: TRAP transporter large permease subunit [Desulfarculus sp.]|nr:TRAP transporter large permease subunit [Pseudomonadota bacterium]MBV1716372.1 TRAP transporter large permease subunit [Desulfarculus sp.]MBU4574986.1 TRAP transporter large permease subunit [Pseudomonadota bacterium]MBU4598521.1 TRAP transporter large permease subunit [Pseudomonadota bacterium]MBV1736856.1 TRAP transporter large permease subunit [Desulfarculus sp.]